MRLKNFTTEPGSPHAVILVLMLLLGAALPSAEAEPDSPAAIFAARQAAVVALTCDGPNGLMRYYGTGVVITPDGLVLSNITVVPDGARDIRVSFTDGRVLPASLVATDASSEAALLRVRASELDHMALTDSDTLAVGAPVFTWGNPHHSLERDGMVSFSQGVVSGRYHLASADDQSRYRGPVIEVDAAVNPGSDGGPVTDAHGHLVGIMSLAFSRERWLGAAIPTAVIRSGLAEQGITLPDPVPPVTAEHLQRHWPVQALVQERLAEVAPAVVAVLALDDDTQAPDRRPSEAIRGPPIPAPLQAQAERQLHRPLYASGVLVDEAGLVLTSATGLADSRGGIAQLWVYLADGSRHAATPQAYDRQADLALVALRDPPTGLPVLPLAATDPGLHPGETVFLVGRSQAPGQATCTVGRISAVRRHFGIAYQISAAMNYGNIGGAVCDLHGRLIGLATWLGPESDWRQNAGVGFAIRADFLRRNLPGLQADEAIDLPERAFFGILGDPLSVDGVRIKRIVPDSAAAAGGLLEDDLLLSVDGVAIRDWGHFSQLLEAHRPGETVTVRLRRLGELLQREVTLGVMP